MCKSLLESCVCVWCITKKKKERNRSKNRRREKSTTTINEKCSDPMFVLYATWFFIFQLHPFSIFLVWVFLLLLVLLLFMYVCVRVVFFSHFFFAYARMFYSIVLHKTFLPLLICRSTQVLLASYLSHCLSYLNEYYVCECEWEMFFTLFFLSISIFLYTSICYNAHCILWLNIWWKCKSFLHRNATLARLMFQSFELGCCWNLHLYTQPLINLYLSVRICNFKCLIFRTYTFNLNKPSYTND